MPAKRASPGMIELTAEIMDIEPKVWRRLRIPADFTLSKLHTVLQLAFGWEDCHLHEFRDGRARVFAIPHPDDERRVTSSKRTLVCAVLQSTSSTLLYNYDFGDDWRVMLKVVGVAEALEPPSCIAGERAGPPEDCGGIPGYGELLEALADPQHEQHEELTDWAPVGFDPESFDLIAVNKALAREFRRK